MVKAISLLQCAATGDFRPFFRSPLKGWRWEKASVFFFQFSLQTRGIKCSNPERQKELRIRAKHDVNLKKKGEDERAMFLCSLAEFESSPSEPVPRSSCYQADEEEDDDDNDEYVDQASQG